MNLHVKYMCNKTMRGNADRWCPGTIHAESESTLELQSRVAPSVEYVTTNMVPTQEAIPEEGR